MRLTMVFCFYDRPRRRNRRNPKAVSDRYYNTFSHTNLIFLRINQGDIVVTKTLDSSGLDDRGQVRATGGNPFDRAIYVNNAEPAMRSWYILARCG